MSSGGFFLAPLTLWHGINYGIQENETTMTNF